MHLKQQHQHQRQQQQEQAQQEHESQRAKWEQERQQWYSSTGSQGLPCGTDAASLNHAAAAASSGSAASAVLLHHLLHLQQDVAALKVGAQHCMPQAEEHPASLGNDLQERLPTSGPQRLPSLGRQPQGQSMDSKPAIQAQSLFAEVRSWLQHESAQLQQQLVLQESHLEAGLHAPAPGAMHLAPGEHQQPEAAPAHLSQQYPGGGFPAHAAWFGQVMQPGVPAFDGGPAQHQQQERGVAQRPLLHEPRQPVAARPASAKRRQVQPRSPSRVSRWDYRPAWSEGLASMRGLRVDDLPASAAAARAQQVMRAGTIMVPRVPALNLLVALPVQADNCTPKLAANSPRSGQPAGQSPLLQVHQQQLPCPPAAHAQLPLQDAGGSSHQTLASAVPYEWVATQPMQVQGAAHVPGGGTGFMSGAGPHFPPPLIPPGGGASPVIHQYFAPALPSPFATYQPQQSSYAAAAIPLSRPATACSSYAQHYLTMPQSQLLPPPVHSQQHFDQNGNQMVDCSEQFGQYQQQVQQHHQRQQRPATPGVALGGGTSAASEAWTPHGMIGTTSLTKSASAKVSCSWLLLETYFESGT